jgi:hypothetical protein
MTAILAMSNARTAPKATVTAASGRVRRHGRHAATTTLTPTSSGAHALSSRSITSTSEIATRAEDSAQSRQTRTGGRAGRGSAQIPASMLPPPGQRKGAAARADQPKVLRMSRACGQDSSSPQADVASVNAGHG